MIIQNNKNQWIAFLLALFLGSFGAHKFYLGRTKPGIFYALFFWTLIPAVLGLIDALLILNMPDWKWQHKINSQPIPEDVQRRLDPANYLSNEEVLKQGLKRGLAKAAKKTFFR